MVTEETKSQLVDIAVKYFLNNQDEPKDRISYSLLNCLFKNEQHINELETAGLLLASTAIVHNIPRKNAAGVWDLRPYTDCYGGLITFWKANNLEKFVIKFSNEQAQIDLVSQRILPSLKFLNTNNEYLTAGLGKAEPDLIDCNDDITYEVKSNYRKRGSLSGFHSAKMLVDCDGAHIFIYPVLYDGSIDFSNNMFCFRNVIPEEVVSYSHAINPELLTLIKTGELIKLVEDELANQNFIWNKNV